MRNIGRFTSLLMGFVVLCVACGPASLPGLPSGSPFAEDLDTSVALTHGVAAGDVSDDSAVVWFRTNGPAKARIAYKTEQEQAVLSPLVLATFETDYTAHVKLTGLKPHQQYEYYVLSGDPMLPDKALRAPSDAGGSFSTAARPETSQRVTFVWSGDLGGQQRCRRGSEGYPIFEQMQKASPDFAILLGDTIYADDRCPSPPNEPGGDFVATSLEGFRAKHRYQRGALALQRFLSVVPVYVLWDDHEVRNNFSGLHDPLMPAGRQALFEYWPIARSGHDENRLYRQVRWGADVELFLLDARQYRSANGEKDGPQKTMLGEAQRRWLLDGLRASTATWKFIVSSVPLSIPKGGGVTIPGNDSWARGTDGTGFLTELRAIAQVLVSEPIRNVIWLTGDVHSAQVNRYDADDDGRTDFYEFVCGPLSAAPGRGLPPNPDLHPTTLFNEAGFENFGTVTVDKQLLTFVLRDAAGTVRFSHEIRAQPADH